jgi:hypothetical protein
VSSTHLRALRKYPDGGRDLELHTKFLACSIYAHITRRINQMRAPRNLHRAHGCLQIKEVLLLKARIPRNGFTSLLHLGQHVLENAAHLVSTLQGGPSVAGATIRRGAWT